MTRPDEIEVRISDSTSRRHVGIRRWGEMRRQLPDSETVREDNYIGLAEKTEERKTVREDKRIALADKTEDRLALEARERSSLAKKKFDMESRASCFQNFAALLKAGLNREEAKEELGPIPSS